MKHEKWSAEVIGDLFYARLQESTFRGRVSAIFKNVVNIEEADQLYTLGKALIGRGPRTVLVPGEFPDFDGLLLKPGELVIAGEEWLKIGQLTVSLQGAKIYTSLRDEKIDRGKIENFARLLPDLKILVLREGNLSGLGGLLENSAVRDFHEGEVLRRARLAVAEIEAGLLNRTTDLWGKVKMLIGLGPGLTPAGDDFLTGMFYVFHYLRPPGGVRLPDCAVSAIKKATNPISAAELILALEGRPFELIDDVLQSMFSGEKTRLTLSTLRLLERGSTSGTDILTGVIFAGEIFLRLKEEM